MTQLGPQAPPPNPAVDLVKLHGLGNDFLVALDPPFAPDAALARRCCDRHEGIGADGLVVGRRLGRGGPAVLSFELFNADGSEAEMSGNGMRCLAHVALDDGIVASGVPFVVTTPAGDRSVVVWRRARAEPTALGRAGVWGSVEMGEATVSGETDRCNVGHGQALVDIGNPHLVVAGPDPAGLDLAVLGPRLEASRPGGVNVEFVTLGPGPDEVTMRVWERGVGETRACGTGSCAAAAAFRHWGRVSRSVTVHQPGGSLVVELAEDGSVRLSGPSVRVADCRFGTSRPETARAENDRPETARAETARAETGRPASERRSTRL